MKKSILNAAIFAAINTLAVLAVAPVAHAANVDNINSPQNYQYYDASGNAYTLYDFDGPINNILQFGSTSGYGPEIDNAIVLPGVETTNTSSTVENGEIQWQAGGQPTNRLAILSTNPVAGNGVLAVVTDPFSGGGANYLNLILGGDQSLGAANLNFEGWGRIAFGSKSGGFGDTQSLSLFDTTSAFSGIIDFYHAHVSLRDVSLLGNGYFTSEGGVNTVDLGSVYSPGNVAFGDLTPAGSSITFNIGAVQAKNITIGGSAPGKVTFNMGFGGTINLGGAGAALLDASAVNLGEVGVSGSVDLMGGNLTISPSLMGLEISGNYAQSGGNLILDITPSGQSGFIGAENYKVTGGNVIVDGEAGNYANGRNYRLLESGATNGASVYAPANTYYVYNGAQGSQIDGLNPYLHQVTASNGQQSVQLCLGSACLPAAQPAPTPAKTTPAPAPAKVTPQPVIPAAPVIPVIPVRVVTPVQEAKPVLADSPQVTEAAAQNTAQTLISTGVVGGGPRGVWLKTLGGFSSQDGYQGMNYGLLAGYGKSVGPDGRDVAGVAFSAGQAGLGTGVSDFARASDYGLWIYGTYYPQASRQWKITGTLGGGLSQNTLMSTALGLPQVAHFGGGFVGTQVRASYWKTMDGIIVSPRLSVGYNQSWTGGYSTHGGSFLDVHVSGQNDGQLYLSPAILVGKKFDYRSQSGRHTLFPQVRLGVVENIGPNPSAEISSGQVAGQVQGLAYPHLQGMAEVRLDVISHTKFSKGLSANVSARQLFGGGASSTEFVAAVKYHW